MIENLQIGIDIATSISIIGAAISFVISQRKSRDQQQRQYAVSNLQTFIGYIQKQKKNYDKLGNELRENPTQDMLDRNILETIFFLEDVKRELYAQNFIYFPIFSPSSKAPASFLKYEGELNSLLDKAKQGRKCFAEVTEKVEPYLIELEKTVANELKLMLRKG